MNHRAVRALIGVVAALALSACGPKTNRADNDVRVAFYSDVTSLSLVGNSDASSAQIASLISDGLVAYDAQTRYVPMVARAWELSPDGRILTFHLRDDVRWHDGERVTSKDVAYTAAKIKDPATQARSWASQFSNVASIDTPDDLTVVVHYTKPYADALEPWRAPLVPEHVASKDANFLAGAFALHPIGCGPFRFVSRDPGRSLVLDAFDQYWGGRPAIDRMIVKIVAAERTGFEALMLGDLDLLVVTPDLWLASRETPAAARFASFRYYRLGAWKVDWNQDRAVPYFRDPRVRRAMVLALDRQRFAATVAAGLARPGVSSYPPESPWSDTSIPPWPFDPSESARLLDAAGWHVTSHGRVRERAGTPFAFTMLVPAGAQGIADSVAAWMQQSVAEIGVSMKIEKLEFKAFQKRRQTHVFEAAMASVMLDPVPDQFELYHTTARDGGFNYGGFSDPEVDRLLEDGRVTVEPAARRAIYVKLQKRLHDLEPISFLFQFEQSVLHDPDLEGVVPSPIGLYQFAPGPRAWRWSRVRTRR